MGGRTAFHDYCDFFLLPDHTHYASQHSYILELKVLSRKEFDEELKDVFKEDGSPMKKSEKQWLDAVEQIRRYAARDEFMEWGYSIISNK